MGCLNSAPNKVEAASIPPNDPQKEISSSPPLITDKSQYEFLSTLGEGASCKVMRATKKSTNQKFAVKILTKLGVLDCEDSELLYRNEVKVLQTVSHPNILEFVESFEDSTAFYIVTVLCEGGELFDRVVEGQFTELKASLLTKQMLLALQHCHERNISHRDLKPENFVFSTRAEDSPMKLIDFGCAVQANDDSIVEDVAGSPYYVAPEVLNPHSRRTGKMWKASDMWSIGVIVFLLIHGYPPFNGERQDQIFMKIKIGKFKFGKDIALSDSVKDLITKLLAMKPEERLTSSSALQHPWIAQASAVAPDTPIPATVLEALTHFKVRCRLKKAVGRAMASRMTEEDRKALEAIFNKFDLNGDGQLGPDEIAAMMKHIGRNEREAQDFMAAADDNNDGVISIDEFAAVQQMGKLSGEDTIKASFDMFDKDHDGFVTATEIEKVCTFLDPEMAKQIVADVDENGDGKINFFEWITAMKDIQAKKIIPI